MQTYLSQVLDRIGRNDDSKEELPEELSREQLVATALEVSSRMVDEVAEWRWLHTINDARIG